jgi:hypothetical protein
MLDDIVARYRRHGASLRGIYVHACDNALDMGRFEEAGEFRRLAWDAPADRFAEPPEWELYYETDYLLTTGQEELAIAHARPMLDGRLPSYDVYRWIAMLLMVPLVKHRRLDEALSCHLQGYRSSATNPKYTAHCGAHITFLAVTRNYAKAARLMEKHLAWAAESAMPCKRFSFFLNCCFFMRQLQREGRGPLSLNLPPSFEPYREDGDYDPRALGDWFEREVRHWEEQFNRRNGNAYYTRVVGERFALADYTFDYPVDH